MIFATDRASHARINSDKNLKSLYLVMFYPICACQSTSVFICGVLDFGREYVEMLCISGFMEGGMFYNVLMIPWEGGA
jgi:hypothetical protein